MAPLVYLYKKELNFNFMVIISHWIKDSIKVFFIVHILYINPCVEPPVCFRCWGSGTLLASPLEFHLQPKCPLQVLKVSWRCDWAPAVGIRRGKGEWWWEPCLQNLKGLNESDSLYFDSVHMELKIYITFQKVHLILVSLY